MAEFLDKMGLSYFWDKINQLKQDKLVSGTNIKTVNNESLLGTGNISAGSVLDFYPVGSYYETSDSTFNPNTAWGGTWELETEGQVHVSAGSNYPVSGALNNSSDGGDKEVTLTENQIPAHTHGSKSLSGHFTIRKTYNQANNIVSVDGIVSSANSGSGGQTATNGTSTSLQQITINATHEHSSVGGGQAHNNMQPYIIVRRWHRTA